MSYAIRLRGYRLPVVFSIFILHACGSSGGGAPPTENSVQSENAAPAAPTVTPASITAATATIQSSVTRYLNPTHSMAKDSGAGTVDAPYKTLAYSVKQLRTGETLIIAAGTYREAIDLRTATNYKTSAATPSAVTKIVGATGAAVVLKGSDVIGDWEKVSTNTFVRRNWNVNTQQVFLDGAPLKQIGGSIFNGYPDKAGNAYASILAGSGGIWPGRINGTASALVDNSFYYDAASASLFVRAPYASLAGHSVEASTRTFAIFGADVNDLSIENIRVEHSNTTATLQNGAVTLLGSRLKLNRIEVKYADGAGFDVSGDDSTLQNLIASYCGQVGIKFRGSRSALLDSTVSYNNTRGFNKWWEAGGAKFVGNGGLQDSTVAGNKAYFNQGDGIWFDYKNARNKVYNNSVAYNTGMGVHYEASMSADVYRNRIFGNGQRGIYMPNVSNSVIAHNLIIYNGLEAIAIVDERNAVAQNLADLIPSGNYVAANVIGWNGKSALVLPAGQPAVSDANLFIGMTAPTFSVGWASSTNPLLTGLVAWIAATRHDGESWQRSMMEPAALKNAILSKNTAPDFSAIDSVAAEYTVPLSRLPKPLPLIVTGRPGPK